MLRSIALAFLLAQFAAAQNITNLQWWNSPVRNDLGLNQDQTQKIREIVRSFRSKLLDARNNANKAEGELEDVFNDTEVNSKQATQAINKLASARSESSRVFLEMSVQLRSVLTLDQWRTLVRRSDEVRRRRAADTQVPP
jgi:Spy/CpxP family protein refolding chaperone